MRRSAYCCVSCSQAARRGYEPSGIRGQKKRSCLWCSVTFRPATGKQKFCRKECAMASGVDGRKRFTVNCEVCDTAFKSRTGNHTKTCSSDCSKKLRQQRRLEQRKLAFGPPRTCKQCAKVFTYGGEAYKGWCSKLCRAEYTKERRSKESMERSIRDAPIRFGETRTCVWCNSKFGYGSGGYYKWCSVACRSQQTRDSNRRHDHQRRAMERSAKVEHVSPAYIFKRDKYTCQSCKKKTRPDKKPTHPLYPTLDHIIPLSKGGEHLKKNCQCLCRDCNTKKGARAIGDQLLLFG